MSRFAKVVKRLLRLLEILYKVSDFAAVYIN
jgi:hypothetical protein